LSQYLQNSLDGPHTDFVKRHLRSCSVCRRELADREALARKRRSEQLQAISANPDFERLLTRVHREPMASERFDAAPPPGPGWSRSVEAALGPGRLILSVAIVFTALLIVFLWSGKPEVTPAMSGGRERYTDLNVRATFEAGLAIREIEALLAPFHGQILEGPDAQGVYLLRGRGLSTEQFLERLRRTGKVAVAEPVEPRGAKQAARPGVSGRP
jgi:hypothetical protein